MMSRQSHQRPTAPPLAAEAARSEWARPLPPALTTGLRELDRALGGGLRMESIGVLAGPTGRGKTGLAIQIARHVAAIQPVLYMTSELSARQVLARFAAQGLRRPWAAIYDSGPS